MSYFLLACLITCGMQVALCAKCSKEQIMICSKDATCNVLSNGNVTCTCNSNFKGNGTYCKVVNECLIPNYCKDYLKVCEKGSGCYCRPEDLAYKEDLRQTKCAKKGKCNDSNPICGDNAFCKNYFKGHFCKCKSGYTGNPYNIGCTDIDECETENLCHSSTICKNLPGSYQCISDVKIINKTQDKQDGDEDKNTNQDKCKDDTDYKTVVILVSLSLVIVIFVFIALALIIFLIFKKIKTLKGNANKKENTF
ncbi:adhesion G protein-coupled receptor E2-like isoform X2 [Xenia sp. Carnegie-2017]|uniref:adhesion G protein-coupled receptor E2-like isoform X2 n=1 Tax=Xenia sp. Carnegie-2017 TaxID=2897299 RepID=UPI001F0493CF|nr:adhesion G protein-coupled receptor E2-like isoform X2 [Xenia sp. Carnegie-2017]